MGSPFNLQFLHLSELCFPRGSGSPIMGALGQRGSFLQARCGYNVYGLSKWTDSLLTVSSVAFFACVVRPAEPSLDSLDFAAIQCFPSFPMGSGGFLAFTSQSLRAARVRAFRAMVSYQERLLQGFLHLLFAVLVYFWRLRCGLFARPVSRLLLFLNAFSQPRDTRAPRLYFVFFVAWILSARYVGCYLLGKGTHVVYTV